MEEALPPEDGFFAEDDDFQEDFQRNRRKRVRTGNQKTWNDTYPHPAVSILWQPDINSGGYKEMAYAEGALASSWREPTVETGVSRMSLPVSAATGVTVCAQLFDTVPLRKKPGDLLVEPVQREENLAAAGDLSEADRAARVREKRAADRALALRELKVRLAREALGFYKDVAIDCTDEQLQLVHASIRRLFTDASDDELLTKEEVIMWCFHEKELSDDLLMFHRAKLSSLQA